MHERKEVARRDADAVGAAMEAVAQPDSDEDGEEKWVDVHALAWMHHACTSMDVVCMNAYWCKIMEAAAVHVHTPFHSILGVQNVHAWIAFRGKKPLHTKLYYKIDYSLCMDALSHRLWRMRKGLKVRQRGMHAAMRMCIHMHACAMDSRRAQVI